MPSLLQILEITANEHHSKTAIHFESHRCTYVSLVGQIVSAKKLLQTIGIRNSKQRIILSGNNSIDLLVLFFSLLSLGLDIIFIDPKTTEKELKILLESIPVNYLLLEKKIFPNMPASLAEVLSYQLIKKEIQQIKKENSTVFFTSTGTTGLPKVFGFSEEKIIEQLTNLINCFKFDKNDRVLCPVSFTHSHGFVMSIPFLLLGATLHYLHPENATPLNLVQHIHLHQISILTGVPFQYNVMVENKTLPIALNSLRYAFCGSAPMSEYLATNFEKKFAVRLNQAYGVSEIGPICVNLFEENKNNFLSVGKVIKNIHYKIVDENDKEVPTGNEGELLVKSNFMTSGYINADNENLFRNGWMCTQDIVRQDDFRNIYILGRKSNFINISGYKVYPIEIEKVILSIKGIKDVVIVGVDDEKRTQVIKAYISTFYPLTISEIKDFCKKHLSKYKIPHEIVFTDEMPTNSIGKVIKSKL